MSVYGGDSWAREAQNRKRRVDDLMIEAQTHDSSCFKKLSGGKFACLVCPHNPLLDSSLMLSMHSKGGRHRAALRKLKERERVIQEELSKRLALSDNSPASSSGNQNSAKKLKLPSKPLIEQTWKLASDLLNGTDGAQSKSHENHGWESSVGTMVGRKTQGMSSGTHHSTGGDCVAAALPPMLAGDFRERREKELKFTAAGWKRDCYGKWYRDENVEFDSDEEDPNVCLQ